MRKIVIATSQTHRPPRRPRTSSVNAASSQCRSHSLSVLRVSYSGGYLLPGDTDPQPSANNPQPVRLPSDLEFAAIEQIAFWFQNRDKTGLKTNWPKSGIYQQFATQDLLASVSLVLEKHRHWTL